MYNLQRELGYDPIPSHLGEVSIDSKLYGLLKGVLRNLMNKFYNKYITSLYPENKSIKGGLNYPKSNTNIQFNKGTGELYACYEVSKPFSFHIQQFNNQNHQDTQINFIIIKIS